MFKITPQKHTEMPATRHSRETMRVNSYLMRHEAASIPQSLRIYTHNRTLHLRDTVSSAARTRLWNAQHVYTPSEPAARAIHYTHRVHSTDQLSLLQRYWSAKWRRNRTRKLYRSAAEREKRRSAVESGKYRFAVETANWKRSVQSGLIRRNASILSNGSNSHISCFRFFSSPTHQPFFSFLNLFFLNYVNS